MSARALDIGHVPKLDGVIGSDPDRPVEIWHVPSLTRRQILCGHTNEVNALAFSPDGRLIATGSWDQTIMLWELPSGRPLKTLRGHIDGITALLFTADGKTLISGSREWHSKNCLQPRFERRLIARRVDACDDGFWPIYSTRTPMRRNDDRNIAIIAPVDHLDTTLVD
jgi:WD40 repeat protein